MRPVRAITHHDLDHLLANCSGDFYHNAAWTDIDLFFGTLAASLPVLNSLIPKKWRSRSPSVEDPEKMAARLRNPDRNLDSDSTLHGGRELRFHSEDILDASANASTRGSNSFDDSNVDGTVRVQQPPHALPRDRLNQAPYSRSDFL